MAGNLYYSGSTAFSQNPKSPWYKLRIESSGAFPATSMGNAPPVKDYTFNNRADINTLTKLKYLASKRDRFNLTLGINHSFLQVYQLAEGKSLPECLGISALALLACQPRPESGQKFLAWGRLFFRLQSSRTLIHTGAGDKLRAQRAML